MYDRYPVPRSSSSGRARKILAALALAAAVAPLFVALVAAHDEGWRPLGDDAAISVLTHDVFSTRTPLLGMPTSLGTTDADRSHHPGPLEFWSLAPLERAFGSGPFGILAGVVAVNAAAIVLIGVVVSRLTNARTALAALALCAALAWSFGRQNVVDPWNPFIALFPMFALCVLTWAAVSGRRYALWGVALVGSYVAEAHLLYVPLAAGLFVTAVLGVAESMLRRRRHGLLRTRDAAVTAGGTLAVLAIAWALPVYDQLAHEPGNFTGMWRSLHTKTAPHVGLRYAWRVMVDAIGLPPLFLRRNDNVGYVGAPANHLGALAIFTAILLVAVLAGATIIAIRRRDRVAAAVGLVAGISFAITTAVVARLPAAFPGLPEYRLLQCWVISAFAWLATGYVVARAFAPRLGRLPQPTARLLRVAALVPLVAVLASAPIAIAYADSAGLQDARLFPEVERLASGIATRVDHHRAYQLDVLGDEGLLGADVGHGVLRDLIRLGLHVGVPASDYSLTRSHLAPRSAAHLVIAVGRVAVEQMAASPDRRLAQFRVATAADDRTLRLDTERLRSFLRQRSALTAKGRDVLSIGAPATDVATLTGLLDGSLDPIALLDNGRIPQLWFNGLLRADVFTSRAYNDFSGARHTVDDLVFAAYLEP